nr:MAG TPA: hypothetical protein [Caudoviricetes sp.]
MEWISVEEGFQHSKKKQVFYAYLKISKKGFGIHALTLF